MSDYFHCVLCDKSFKNKSKKIHLYSQYHQFLTRSIISKYYVTNPSFLPIEDIIKKYVKLYNKKFEFYLIICEWKLHFTDTIIYVKSEKLHIIHRGWDLRRYLIAKIENYTRCGYKFSHISKMNITFITDLRNTT